MCKIPVFELGLQRKDLGKLLRVLYILSNRAYKDSNITRVIEKALKAYVGQCMVKVP